MNYDQDSGTSSFSPIVPLRKQYGPMVNITQKYGWFPPAMALKQHMKTWRDAADRNPAFQAYFLDSQNNSYTTSGGMLTPSIGMLVDHGASNGAETTLICTTQTVGVPLSIPDDKFFRFSNDRLKADGWGFLHPLFLENVLDPKIFSEDYATIVESGVTPPNQEFRFIAHETNLGCYSIPSARCDTGTMMAFCGYGAKPTLPNFLRDYYAHTFAATGNDVNKTIERIKATPFPQFEDVRNLFEYEPGVLTLSPAQHQGTLFDSASAFTMNGSLTSGHCGSFGYSIEDPTTFFGAYCGFVIDNTRDGSYQNIVWSVRDPYFVSQWVHHALPYFIDICTNKNEVVKVVEYLEDVSPVLKCFELETRLDAAKNKLNAL
eukprot:TRINITY_DN2191_c0_g1_i2.p1 TRINITY_DN2191_c0_g1~~TRINITY_DN2191_c0_g1_i2.p1  ORF type:complete len:375 (+),score=37.69 TRINITY_DN2191_c0_g1_i2:270-1394(+)